MGLPKTESVDRLFETILNLKTKEECYLFFEDLCTVKEILTLSQRYDVAHLLDEGESYLSVTDKTGASSATVGRVKRCLDYGSGGYRLALEREKTDVPGAEG